MRPDVWGPPAWIFLHSITLEYPDNPTKKDKQDMRNFFDSLGKVLPCHKCRNNFQMHFTKKPLTDGILCCKKNLVKWLIDIHNSVDMMNNKKAMTYEEALRQLLSCYERKSNYNMIIIYILILIIILFIFFTIYLMKF